tara:strand:- start:306 stop:494 length:189 start_codon:yes stop_codon:yes gene_type:complete
VQRAINRKKFYTSLPHKIDREEEAWHQAQPVEENKWTTKEAGTFGKDGWSISTSYDAMDKND